MFVKERRNVCEVFVERWEWDIAEHHDSLLRFYPANRIPKWLISAAL